MSKSKLKWSEKEEDADFDAAFKYLSLLCSDRKAHALVKSLRGSKLHRACREGHVARR